MRRKVTDMPTKPMNPAERIKRSVSIDSNGCWNWKLSKDSFGYGRLKVQLGARDKFRFSSVHRYSYEVFTGEIPAGMNVLHKCDNRACCNPIHLFIGSQQDNMRDMHAKGRGPRGYKRDSEVCSQNAKMRNKLDAAIAKEQS